MDRGVEQMGRKAKEKDASHTEWQRLNVTRQGDVEVEDIKILY